MLTTPSSLIVGVPLPLISSVGSAILTTKMHGMSLSVQTLPTQVIKRTEMGRVAFGKYITIRNSNPSVSLKVKTFSHVFYKSYHIVQEYGALQDLERKLHSTLLRIERTLLCIIWRDRKQISWIWEQTKAEDILLTIKEKKWTLPGQTKCQSGASMNFLGQRRQRVRWRIEMRTFVGAA